MSQRILSSGTTAFNLIAERVKMEPLEETSSPWRTPVKPSCDQAVKKETLVKPQHSFDRPEPASHPCKQGSFGDYSVFMEFVVWFCIVIVVFLLFNTYLFWKRFASILFAFLVASAIVFMAFHSFLSEVLITATFLMASFYGLTEAARARRTDANIDKSSRQA